MVAHARTRLGVGIGVLVALVGGIIGTAPAATASSQVHTVTTATAGGVTKGWRAFRTQPVVINKVWYSVSVKAASKQVVTLSNGERAYASYRVKVGGDGLPVKYNTVLSPWRALYAYEGFTSTPRYVSNNLQPPTYTNRSFTATTAQINRDSVKQISRVLLAYRAAQHAEAKAFNAVMPLLATFTGAWYPAGPPKDFNTYPGAHDYVAGELRNTVTIRDKNTAILRVYVTDDVWIGAKVVNGKAYPLRSTAIAAKQSAAASGFILWSYRYLSR